MKLNLGSGIMIKEGHVNFDAVVWTSRAGLKTNVIGRIENMPFKLGVFEHIFCTHVLEHFNYPDALDLLRKCLDLLQTGGTCTIETPCVVGAYDYYVVKHNNIKKYLETLYGAVWHKSPHGEFGVHRSGWTREILAEEMAGVGFTILKTSHGLSHGMGNRDLRVHARKG